MSALVLHVRLHDGRYHGQGDWPPSPARLFQALVAGVGVRGALGDTERKACEWLEKQWAPIIAAPLAWQPRRGVLFYMPNNDSDSIGGDPAQIAKIRTATKISRPYFFDAGVPFVYAWPLSTAPEDHGFAKAICLLAENLYQLGRGIDMAWALGEILDDRKLDEILDKHPGRVFRPSVGKSMTSLASPCSGSLKSIEHRYRAFGERFRYVKDGRIVKVVFRRPPKTLFQPVAYDSPPSRSLYELRDMAKDAAFLSWPLKEVVRLVETVRNNAAERMKRCFPGKLGMIERVFGLCRNMTEADKLRRLRIIPLPSIGHPHADRGIRRLLVEIPPDCPLPAKDIEWAFSAVDQATGEIQGMLVRADDHGMLDHYGILADGGAGYRVWRTVTPMALPILRPRGRKKGLERATIESETAAAVIQALRHTGVATKPVSIRVQREPFDGKNTRAEDFATGTRFPSARLWHAEIGFAQPVRGPLAAGDGRYLGLGLMAPVRQVVGTHAFSVIGGLSNGADTKMVAQTLRRAVMALVQDHLGPRTALPTFFTGHEANGSPARRGGRAHLAFAFDAARQRLLVIAPHLLEGRAPNQEERGHLFVLDAALRNLRELRAGSAGLLQLKPVVVSEDDDPLFARATTWETQTDYRLTRYGKRMTAEEAIIADVGLELRRRGLPTPVGIEELDVSRGPKGGLSAKLRIVFSIAIAGPLLLGKGCNLGSGLFIGIR